MRDNGFQQISRDWLRAGWDARYPYTFSWAGLPVFQIGDDLVRLQELIWRENPAVIIETGVGEGGGQAFLATTCAMRQHGRVIGIEQDLQRNSRPQLSRHPLIQKYCTLVEGDSADPAVFAKVKATLSPQETVLVILDSCHTRAHVRAELDLWSTVIRPGGWIVVCDTSFAILADLPNGRQQWAEDNPLAAIADFLADYPDFQQVMPVWPFNQSSLAAGDAPSHLAGGWLQRRSAVFK